MLHFIKDNRSRDGEKMIVNQIGMIFFGLSALDGNEPE